MPYVPPKYPGAIPTAEDLPDRTDDVDWMYAARYNELKKELRAALIELGVDPAGAYATVVARLNALAVVDKISEGDTSVETIDTDADGHVDIKTENVLCGKFNSDGIVDLPKQSRCRVYKAAPDQTIPTGDATKIEFTGVVYDEHNEFDEITNYRFTAEKGGKYLVLLFVRVNSGVDQILASARIYKNGGAHSTANFRFSGTDQITLQVSDVISLATNDYLEGLVLQVTGGNIDLDASMINSFFAIHKLS